MPPASKGPILPDDSWMGGGKAPEWYEENAPKGPTTPPNPAFPDFNVWLQKALERLGIGELDANLRKLQEQTIIDWGDPALAAAAGFSVDPNAAAFAAQNTSSGNSVLARLARAFEDNKRSVINRLAARGILGSGDLGYGLTEASSQYGRNQYDARQKVLGQLAGYMDTYLSRKNAMRQSAWDSYQQAYNNYLKNPSAYQGEYDA